MSADFSTEIKMKGTREDYGALLRLLKYYTIDQQKAYCNGEDAWYFDESYLFDDIAEETIDDYYETYNAEFFGIEITDEMVDVFIKQNESDGRISLMLSGPYGRWNGPIRDEICFFERLADAAPESWFYGCIEGFNPGGEESFKAELKEGLLYLTSNEKNAEEDNTNYAYIHAIMDALSADSFSRLFQADINYDLYWDNIYDMVLEGDFLKVPYERFSQCVENTKLTKPEYAAVIRELKESDFPRYEDYPMNEEDVSDFRVYDPFTKTYKN